MRTTGWPARSMRLDRFVLRGIGVRGIAQKYEQAMLCRRRTARRAAPPPCGITPLPCLPVDSASSCSAHAPNEAIEGDAITVTLSRPWRGEHADHESKLDAGIGAGGTSGPHDCAMTRACSRKARTS